MRICDWSSDVFSSDLLRECLDAGAVGLSTSFVDVDENGRPVPSRFAQFEELDALAAVLGEFGRMLKCVQEFYDTDITIAGIDQHGRASCRERVGQYVYITVGGRTLKNKTKKKK